jgi:hypothetical protein
LRIDLGVCRGIGRGIGLFAVGFCLVIAVGFYIGDLEIVGSLANFTRLSRFDSFVSLASLAGL